MTDARNDEPEANGKPKREEYTDEMETAPVSTPSLAATAVNGATNEGPIERDEGT
jgi:hypothetical protein